MLSKTRFQALVRQTRKKERSADGPFFVEGWRWLEEALGLDSPPACVLAVPGAARTPREAGLLARARAAAPESFEVTPEQLARLTGSVSPPGVAALVRWRPATAEALAAGIPAAGPSLVIVGDGLGDPGNAGTIVRTADWFGAAGVMFGPGSVEPSNPKAVRATMGSLFHLPVAAAESLAPALGRLRAAGLVVVGAALDGEDLRDFSWPGRVALVIGNEAHGLGRRVLDPGDRRVRIPAFGRAESLNAAVATAVLVADWRRVHPPGV